MLFVPSCQASRLRRLACVSAALIFSCLVDAVTVSAQDTEDTPVVYSFSREWPMGPLNGYDQWRSATIAAERLRRFPTSRHTVAWLMRAQRVDDALGVVRRIIEERPEAIGETFLSNAWSEVRSDQTKGHKDRLRELLGLARMKIRALDRESQAHAALAMVNVELIVDPSPAGNDYEVRLRSILEAFPGTMAAALAEVDLLALPQVTAKTLVAYDAIAAARPGTEVAARALFHKGFHLAHNTQTSEIAAPLSDTTGRFLEVLRISSELERRRVEGPFWGGDVRELVLQFRFPDTPIAPDGLARLLDACGTYARSHMPLLEDPGVGMSLERWISFTVPFLVAKYSGAEAADRWFDDIERTAPDRPSAKLLRASWLSRSAQITGPQRPRPTDAAESQRLMSELAKGQGPAARRALVGLATRLLMASEFDAARTLFGDYLQRFPDAPEAWLAGLRIGQIDDEMGNHREAARRFSDVADRYVSIPFARVLGSGYAGRSLEAAGRYEEARRQYAHALTAWMPPVYEWLSAGWPLDQGVMGPFTIRRPDVSRRVRQLERVLPLTEGHQLANAQWLLANGRLADARRAVEPLAARGSRSSTALEARAILRRTQLDEAVALASAEATAPDVTSALGALEDLTREPFDAAGNFAGIVRATLLMLDGQRDASEAAMRKALQSWLANGATAPPPATGSIEQDVLAVRDALFQPLGGPPFDDEHSRWNGFEWPTVTPRFLIAPRVLRVTRPGHALPIEVDVSRRPAGLTNVLFLDVDDVEYLTTLVSKLGGTKRREPTGIMEVPNQPQGGAMAVLQWWDTYFPTRPGHWGGVELLTYPAFTTVEFSDASRTRALVPMNIGYAGATAVLEKVKGRWVIKELVNRWVT